MNIEVEVEVLFRLLKIRVNVVGEWQDEARF